MTEQRRDPFLGFREGGRNVRIGHIEHALGQLKGATYRSVTSLAISVAKLVTDAELAARVADGGGPEEEPAPMSHITLLKNDHYREILERYPGVTPKKKAVQDVVDLEAHRALQFKCGSLESQIEILKQMIVNQDSSEGLEYKPDPLTHLTGCELTAEDARFLFGLLDSIFEQLEGAVEIVLPMEEGDDREAGLHGPYGLIRSHEEMEYLQSIRDRVGRGVTK